MHSEIVLVIKFLSRATIERTYFDFFSTAAFLEMYFLSSLETKAVRNIGLDTICVGQASSTARSACMHKWNT